MHCNSLTENIVINRDNWWDKTNDLIRLRLNMLLAKIEEDQRYKNNTGNKDSKEVMAMDRDSQQASLVTNPPSGIKVSKAVDVG